MNTKTTVIYHRADFDGIFCREIARKFLGNENVEYIGWDFGDAPPAVPPEGTIYILDLPVDRVFGVTWPGACTDVDRLINDSVFSRLIWIDHHKSSMETHPAELAGYRIDGVAACRLAWCWFDTLQKNCGNAAGGFSGETAGRILPGKEDFVNRHCISEPRAVRLAGEYDVWDKRDPDVDLFQLGLKSRPLTEQDWRDLLTMPHEGASKLQQSLREATLQELVAAGRLVQTYVDLQEAEIVQRLGFLVEFEGLQFLALNSAIKGTHQFKAKDVPETGHDALLKFNWTGREWDVSLYHAQHRTELDLSIIAQKHGGGGHKGACGFRAKALPFLTSLRLPPLEGELQKILGSICFTVAAHARRLHDLGLYNVPRHAEEEQAAFIHWALGLYAQHGDSWRLHGSNILKGPAPDEPVKAEAQPTA